MSSLYPVKKKAPERYTSEFDILKASHKFLRSSDDAKSWDAQLAKKYEDNLFKEFAVCDLKHYKSGNIALRWRTEDEVLSGSGETSCGNTRCPYYDASQDTRPKPSKPPKLTTMELPFSYVEQGETELREAMVKVVLCERCVKKLMWKRERGKKDREDAPSDRPERISQTEAERIGPGKIDSTSKKQMVLKHNDERDHNRRWEHRRSRSRSRSPRRPSEPRRAVF